jgi:tRNA-splicing ligase RtcB
VEDRLRKIAALPDVCYVAVMPDVHVAGETCVGTVIATADTIFPWAIGGDIGCGMAAVALDAGADLLDDESRKELLLQILPQAVPSNKLRKELLDALPGELARSALSAPRLEKLKRRDGTWQLGTLGRGNHFLELQVDQEGRLWLLVHTGSRGMGQAISAEHQSRWKCNPWYGLAARSDAGQAYLSDLQWALSYAAENRLRILEVVDELLTHVSGARCDWSTYFASDHNHVQQENHFGRALWIHRKGTQSAAIEEQGVIPGSMGTPTFHVTGRGHEAALRSCSHGAGRSMSRSEAREKLSIADFQRTMHSVVFDWKHRTSLIDEAPSAYNDIRQVLRAQRDLVRIERELRPVLNYKR